MPKSVTYHEVESKLKVVKTCLTYSVGKARYPGNEETSGDGKDDDDT